MAMREYETGYRDAGMCSAPAWRCLCPGWWHAGRPLLAGNVPNPAAFGLDFMLVAFAAAIGMVLWRGKSDLWMVAAAGWWRCCSTACCRAPGTSSAQVSRAA